MRSVLRPLLTTTAVAGAAAAVALAFAPGEDRSEPPVSDPVALATDDASRRSTPTFAGATPPPGYPDVTPKPGDPGVVGEPIGYPEEEVVAAAVEPPRAAPEPSGAVDGSVWDRLAMCESSGDWASTVGLYEGGLQFHPDTWDAYKPAGYPDAAYQASRAQQILVAERVLAQQGWAAWPACSSKLGLR